MVTFKLDIIIFLTTYTYRSTSIAFNRYLGLREVLNLNLINVFIFQCSCKALCQSKKDYNDKLIYHSMIGETAIHTILKTNSQQKTDI